LDSLLAALRNLAGRGLTAEVVRRGLTAEVVLAHLHHRQIVPLMERPLHIFEMTEDADPVALAKSRSPLSPLLREYAATRARRAIDPKSDATTTGPCGILRCCPPAHW
jgi:predicted Ser/Thr protein kinase